MISAWWLLAAFLAGAIVQRILCFLISKQLRASE